MHKFGPSRRAAAECLGTGMLVTAVIGSGIMAVQLTHDTGLALLCNAVATGAILVVLITIFGPVSGAHFNPAVSLVLALRRDLSLQDLAIYIGAQVAGGVAGAVAAHLMFALPLLQTAPTIRTGMSLWLSEAFATFGLVCVILAGAQGERPSVAWLVGLYITAAYWFTASTSFANPAVTLARAFSDTFSGIRPIDVPGFVVAQVIGSMIALAFMAWLFRDMARPEALR